MTSICGTDGRTGNQYEHFAYVPLPLPAQVELSAATRQAVAQANEALARHQPDLRAEAAPSPASRETLDYVATAEYAAERVREAPITVNLLCDLHRDLVRGTPADGPHAGRVRTIPVAMGSPGSTIHQSNFVPPPPGVRLESGLSDLVAWMRTSADAFDPVVAAALVHYQFQTLHPFDQGNGRLGRLLIVLQLIQSGRLTGPLPGVSAWFEERREHYRDLLAEVSASGDWNPWVSFFARGLEDSVHGGASGPLH